MKEIDRIEGAKYLQSLLRVRDETAPIMFKISQAEVSGKWELKFEAFWGAVRELPLVLERLKTAPEFEGVNKEKFREIQKLEARALGAFIESCELNLEELKTPNRLRRSRIMLKASRANGFWDSSVRMCVAFLRK